jgi:hypothetical protein
MMENLGNFSKMCGCVCLGEGGGGEKNFYFRKIYAGWKVVG